MQQAKYYKMWSVSDCQLKIHIDYKTWRKHYSVFFYKSNSILDKVPPPSINFTSANCIKRYDYLSSGAIDIFSKELAEFLQDKLDVEFVPIVASLKGEPYSERAFYLVHMLDRRNVLDMKHSVYTQKVSDLTGELIIWNIEQVVIDNEKTGNSLAFFFNEDAQIIYSEDIAKAILNAGFKGVQFLPIELSGTANLQVDMSPYFLKP